MTERTVARTPRVLGVYGLALCSGAAGLAYEVSWARQLGLVFGQTARASAVVLAAYFLGMALGYALAGRLSERSRRPLRGFAVAELVAGAWAFAIPACLELVPSSLPTGPARFVMVLLVLLPGTTALGASLPFVARAVGSGSGGTKRIARAYAANLGGAVVGVVVSSLWLLAPLGVVATSWAAASLSISVGLLAWLMQGKFVHTVDESSSSPQAHPEQAWTWIAAAAISGFGTLGAQVLYVRLFSLVFHNSTYTFAAILLVVLFALAMASLAGSSLVRRGDSRVLVVGAALVVAVTLPSSVRILVELQGLRYFSTGTTFYSYITGATLLVAAVVLVPMLAMGVILPLSWKLAGADTRPGRVVGRLTTANTLAAAAGALLASFVLLPSMGLWWSFAVIASVYLLLAVLVSARLERWRWVCGVAIVPSAAIVWGLSEASARVEGVRPGEVLVERFAGAYGWTDVTRDADRDDLYIRQNINYGLGSKSSSAMELRQGQFPLLLHDEPRRVAFIGLATGITASGALDFPEVETITVMELVPEVVDAARYFSEQNAGLLDDPRVRLVVDDGRRVLGSAEDRYEVIVSDLFVPWESKTGYLYTVEHFRAVRARLTEDGVFCLWLAGWQLSSHELEIIAQSMDAVWQHVAVWQLSRHARRPLFALVGVDREHRIPRAELDARMKMRRPPPVGRDYVLRHADDVVAWYVGDWASVPHTPLNTDEHPIIEFSAPKSHQSRGERLKGESFHRFFEERLSGLSRRSFVFEPPAAPRERRFAR